MEMTGGVGPDAVIDTVGLEAQGFFIDNVIDQIKASAFLGTDRTHSIRQAIIACRKGGRVSMPAVYGGFVDKFPLGAFMEKGLTLSSRVLAARRVSGAIFSKRSEKHPDPFSGNCAKGTRTGRREVSRGKPRAAPG